MIDYKWGHMLNLSPQGKFCEHLTIKPLMRLPDHIRKENRVCKLLSIKPRGKQ